MNKKYIIFVMMLFMNVSVSVAKEQEWATDYSDYFGNVVTLDVKTDKIDSNPFIIKSQKTKRIDRNKVLFSINIQNKLTTEVKGEVKLDLPNGWKSSPEVLSFGPLKGRESKIIELIIERMSSKEMSINIPFRIISGVYEIKKNQRIDVPVISRVKSSIKIDGNLDDWKDIEGVDLGSDVCVVKMDEYKGKDDLSGEVKIAYDNQNFYIAAKIIDDVFNQTYKEENVWRGDSIQFAISILENRIFWYEYGVSLTLNGPQLYCWTAPKEGKTGLAMYGDVMVKREKNITVYEVSIPWNELSLIQPEKDKGLSFSFLVNDNDGIERKGWIQYAGGIGDKKDTDLFATFYFVK